MNKTMKNMFAVSASAILMFAGACTNTPEKEEVKAEPAETAAAAGAWTPAEDGTITDELMEIFEKAMDEMTGVSYTPVELLETQIVSGTNYKFLCEAQTVVPGAEKRQAVVTIYRDLNGNAEVLDIEEIEGEEETMLGGWQKAEEGTVTDELQEIFDQAMEGFTGVGYTPVELLETQLVSGMNYRFLCDAVTVVPGAETRQAIVTIYRDLNGNCSILDIQDAE